MNKIRVVHHSKTVGYSGTDRTAQLFCKYLLMSDKYEPFLVYRLGDGANTRPDIAKRWLGDDHVVGYEWEPGKKGRQSPFLPEKDNLYEVLSTINPGIVHVHRSGYAEWPAFRYMAPRAKWVETNIFGYKDVTPERQIDLNIYISEYIRQRALEAGGKDGPVLYNPIEQPAFDMTPEIKALSRQYLIDTYSLPPNAIILGRVGRNDNFDPISLKALQLVILKQPNVFYLVVDGLNGWKEESEKLGIENHIRFIPPIIDDVQLSTFYRGLDIYAHARHDGECCPCNIQEAMMHGIPVVSHESGIYNGQSEIIGEAGFVVPIGDHWAYAEVLLGLIDNPLMANEDESGKIRLRDHFGIAARSRAMRYFEAETTTKQLERFYDLL